MAPRTRSDRVPSGGNGQASAYQQGSTNNPEDEPLLFTLPPELREIIYAYHIAQYPEVVLHTASDSERVVVPRTPLIRVSRQLRAEVTPLLAIHATTLLLRPQNCVDGMRGLMRQVSNFDKHTLANLNRYNDPPPPHLSASQKQTLRTFRTLRPRKPQSPGTALLRYPSLSTLRYELHPTPDTDWGFELFHWATVANMHVHDPAKRGHGYALMLTSRLRFDFCISEQATLESIEVLAKACERRLEPNPMLHHRYLFTEHVLRIVVEACFDGMRARGVEVLLAER